MEKSGESPALHIPYIQLNTLPRENFEQETPKKNGIFSSVFSRVLQFTNRFKKDETIPEFEELHESALREVEYLTHPVTYVKAPPSSATRNTHSLFSYLGGLLFVFTFALGVLAGFAVSSTPIRIQIPAMSKKNLATLAQVKAPSQTIKRDTRVTQSVPPEKKVTPPDGVVNAVVEKNEGYAKISQRVCGTQMYFKIISELNDNRDLQPGDTVLVQCSL